MVGARARIGDRAGRRPGRLAARSPGSREPGHALLAWDDAAYPSALLTIGDPPPVLHYAGELELLNRPALAIVGSRNATPQGRENARGVRRRAVGRGLTIVSGLAQGIDAAAHRGGACRRRQQRRGCRDRNRPHLSRSQPGARAPAGREGGPAVAVHAGHAAAAGKFSPPQSRDQRLVRGVLVVEATPNSGSLITARFAAEQGREVFADSRLDSFAVFQRLSSPDQRRRQARRDGPGRAGGARAWRRQSLPPGR